MDDEEIKLRAELLTAKVEIAELKEAICYDPLSKIKANAIREMVVGGGLWQGFSDTLYIDEILEYADKLEKSDE